MHSPSSRTPTMLAKIVDGNPSGGRGTTSAATGAAAAPTPGDDEALQEFRRSLDLGIAEARAGVGDDWQTVRARMRARFPLPAR